MADFIANKTEGVSQLDVIFTPLFDGLIIDEVTDIATYIVSDPTAGQILEDTP